MEDFFAHFRRRLPAGSLCSTITALWGCLTEAKEREQRSRECEDVWCAGVCSYITLKSFHFFAVWHWERPFVSLTRLMLHWQVETGRSEGATYPTESQIHGDLTQDYVFFSCGKLFYLLFVDKMISSQGPCSSCCWDFQSHHTIFLGRWSCPVFKKTKD